jgi:hypothetical protein
MATSKVLRLQKWIKKKFPIKEANGLHATGHAMGYGFITIEFMDNDYGVWIILCTDYSTEKKEHQNRLNIGTYKSKGDVKRFLKAFKGY